MRRIFVWLIMAMAMSATSSCACSSNSDKAVECKKEPASQVQCPGCDSTSVRDSSNRR